MPTDHVVELLGPAADGWRGSDVVVIARSRHDEVRALDGEMLGLIDRDHRSGELVRPVQYRAVVISSEPAPTSVPMLGGFVPESPARAADLERRRWRRMPGVHDPGTA